MKAMGGTFKKKDDGEKQKGCPVIFWSMKEYTKDRDGNPYGNDSNGKPIVKKAWLLRYYTVFNVEQIDGIEDKIPETETRKFDPIAEGDSIIANMPNAPKIEHGGNRACYSPSLDHVRLPHRKQFEGNAEYYSTAFHELGHATGHTSRLNRDDVMDATMFGSHKYSREELVAEMTAVFLCSEIGLETTFDNSLAYLKNWLGKLKDDTKLILNAGGKAQKAADYILDRKYEKPAKKDGDKKKD